MRKQRAGLLKILPFLFIERGVAMRRTAIGGQAVIEGVMMRGKKVYTLAVRKPDGSMAVEKSPVKSPQEKIAILKLPIFRGIVAFLDSLISGTRLLMRSAEIAGEGIMDDEDGEPMSKFEIFLQDKLGDKFTDYLIYFSVALSMVMAVGMFMVLPVFLGGLLKNYVSSWALGIAEGFIRLFIFLAYIFLISKMKDIQRVFQYHGAEHKTINCFEAEEELTVENVMKHTRLHKRCGTSFLFLVMAISMIVFLFVRTDSFAIRLLSRIVLVPVIAGISYEVLRWAGKSDSKFVDIVSFPGLCLQKWTTKEPDEYQIEAAIAAMNGVIEEEGVS